MAMAERAAMAAAGPGVGAGVGVGAGAGDESLFARSWDAVVIGAGMGGGTAARALAEAGLSVLIVEAGPAGHRREATALSAEIADPVARALRGFWPDPVRLVLEGRQQRLFAPLGSGVGGSSVFYAATLERPEPRDFDPSAEHPHPAGGWPVSHAAMAPWLAAAERLYGVRGAPDPLSPDPGAGAALGSPLPLGAGDAALMAAMRARGLHPYALHAALAGRPGCDGCAGRKCPHDCKRDGRSAGVEPALATGRAALLAGWRAERLEMDGPRVRAVVLRRGGETRRVAGTEVVLAAGALSSPRLLLASAGPDWPEGIGNRTDQVGRHLMFHLNEIFALWPRRGEGYGEASKAIGLRDLYGQGAERWGMVQSMGLNAGYGEILHALRQRLARSPFRALPGLSELARLPAAAAARLLGQAKVFVGLLEDFPYPENRVTDDPEGGGIRIAYAFAPELLARRRRFRAAIRSRLGRGRVLFLTREPEINLGHGCGSLRMGADPATSVTDAQGRVHGTDNLWVADASVFASSMGVNPSLTIAALALRQADHLVSRMGGEVRR